MSIPDFRSPTVADVYQHFRSEEGVWTADGVADAVNRPIRTVRNALHVLQSLGYVADAGMRNNARLYRLR